MSRWRRMRPWALTLVGVLIAGFYLFPVYWMYASSFKLSGEIFSRPPTLIPQEPSLAAYQWVFVRENVGLYLRNSFIIASATTVLTLGMGATAAYALSRIRSRWIDLVLLFILISQVLPPALMATPLFVIFRQLDLTNTLWAVIIANTTKTLPFAIIVLRTTFLQVPLELEEAARVDGCSRFSALLRVILPVARSGVIVSGTLAFLLAYGDFVYGVSFLSRRALQPATVGLYSFVGAEYADWSNIMAFASVLVTPVLVIFLILQRQIVRGLTAGAIK